MLDGYKCNIIHLSTKYINHSMWDMGGLCRAYQYYPIVCCLSGPLLSSFEKPQSSWFIGQSVAITTNQGNGLNYRGCHFLDSQIFVISLV